MVLVSTDLLCCSCVVRPESVLQQEENPGDAMFASLVTFLHCFPEVAKDCCRQVEKIKCFIDIWCQTNFFAMVANSCTVMMKFMHMYHRWVQQQTRVKQSSWMRGRGVYQTQVWILKNDPSLQKGPIWISLRASIYFSPIILHILKCATVVWGL